MKQKECIAMILAGGKGVRLGALTNNASKPMVQFGGRYRIIDFTLSNCTHSGIDTLGVLTQYRQLELHDYIRGGQTWHLDKKDGGVFLLPASENPGPYTGTANAIYQNIPFIERFNPEYVLILSGDHIYKMDYGKMLDFHKKTGADATIAVMPVPLKEASRFGIMDTAENGLVTHFEEKPKLPKSNLASMGIYIFKWSRLKRYLIADKNDPHSNNDFGKNVIPEILASGEKLYAYRFNGYWKDVGTIQSLWESNMDLLKDSLRFDPCDEKWEVFTRFQLQPPRCISGGAKVKRSIVSDGCSVCGGVERSILFNSVSIGEGAEIVDSVIMPGTVIGRNAKIYRTIVGSHAWIGDNAIIGANSGTETFFDKKLCSNDISLIGPSVNIGANVRIKKNSHVENSLPSQKIWTAASMANDEVARLKFVHV